MTSSRIADLRGDLGGRLEGPGITPAAQVVEIVGQLTDAEIPPAGCKDSR